MRQARPSSGNAHDARRSGLILRIFGIFAGACVVLSLLRSGAVVEPGSMNVRAVLTVRDATVIGGTEPPATKKPAARVAEPRVAVEFGTKGIVLCVDDRTVPLGVSLIRELRCSNNEEEIQVYHCSDALSTQNVELLRSIDKKLTIIDACGDLLRREVLTDELARSFQSDWLKPLALHQTTLDEVVLLDVGVVALKNPGILRDVDGYKEKGTVFFYDRLITQDKYLNQPASGSNLPFVQQWLKTFDYVRFNLTQPEAPSSHMVESLAYSGEVSHEQDGSVVVIEKKRSGRAMSVLWSLMTEQRFNTEFSLGAKESYWLAYEFAGAPYFFSPWSAGVVTHSKKQGDAMCGSLSQFFPEESEAPELLYISAFSTMNGEATESSLISSLSLFPTAMAGRHKRGVGRVNGLEKVGADCVIGLDEAELPSLVRNHLWRRKIHTMAVASGLQSALKSCDMGGRVSDVRYQAPTN